jgi:hypothetical protein
MENQNSEKVFVSGLYLNRVSESAPAFVITNQDIHVEKLIAWLTANKHLANEKGYIRITGKESQTKDDKGFNKRYFQVDTYKKPEASTTTEEVPPF